MTLRSIGLCVFLAASALSAPAKGDPASSPGPRSESQAEARRLSDAFAQVAEKVSPSVVQIEVAVREQAPSVARWYRGSPYTSETPVQHGMGSGVILSADGAILTNNHVVEDALTIT